MSHQGSTSHWDPNHWALRSREQRRTTSLRSVSKGEWKVLELCTFCLLQIRPKERERTRTYREQRLLVLKKKRWVCPEKENIGPLILYPQKHILRPIKVVQTTSLWRSLSVQTTLKQEVCTIIYTSTWKTGNVASDLMVMCPDATHRMKDSVLCDAIQRNNSRKPWDLANHHPYLAIITTHKTLNNHHPSLNKFCV